MKLIAMMMLKFKKTLSWTMFIRGYLKTHLSSPWTIDKQEILKINSKKTLKSETLTRLEIRISSTSRIARIFLNLKVNSANKTSKNSTKHLPQICSVWLKRKWPILYTIINQSVRKSKKEQRKDDCQISKWPEQ